MRKSVGNWAQPMSSCQRLGIIGDSWVETVRSFGRRFLTAVGRPNALAALASRGKAWLRGSRPRLGLSIAGLSRRRQTRCRRKRGQHTSRGEAERPMRFPALIATAI